MARRLHNDNFQSLVKFDSKPGRTHLLPEHNGPDRVAVHDR